MMKKITRYILAAIAVAAISLPEAAFAQQSDRSSSSGTVVRRGANDRKRAKNTPSAGVTQRMQSFYEDEPMSDSELQWMRVMYRQIDLTKDANGALYYPDEPVEGQENLFRIIMRLLAADELPAYEYLDGREVFTDQYRLKVRDMLDRFHILYTDAKGSTEKHPKFTIEDVDVPSSEVLSYYIIEKWEFDKRSNRMRTRIEAICPVLHRAGDFYGEAVKYPMFWVKYDELRPYLSTQNIFTDDDNNLATCTYDDFFQLGLYNGEIYKTRNLRNKSLMQLYPDPEDMAHAQDSIQKRLDTFEQKLWVPSLDELAQRREAREKAEELAAAAQSGEEVSEGEAVKKETVSRSSRTKRGNAAKKTKAAKVKKPKSAKSSSGATRSVRNRRR